MSEDDRRHAYRIPLLWAFARRPRGRYRSGPTVIDVLAVAIIVAALACAGLSLTAALLGRVPGAVQVWSAAALELVVLAQIVVAVVQLLRGERPAEFATFLGYLVASVLVLPVAVVWAAAERSRWSSAVLGVAGLVLAVVVLRMQQVWAGA